MIDQIGQIGLFQSLLLHQERQAAYALWKKTPAFHRTVKRGEPGVTDWLRAERDGVMAAS